MIKTRPTKKDFNAMLKTRPMAFMRGLTFPGGQQPVIRGPGIYLRYPRISDYANWARLRGRTDQTGWQSARHRP